MLNILCNLGQFILIWLFFFLLPMPFGLIYEIRDSEKKEAITILKIWAAFTFLITAILHIGSYIFA